ncbi:MAG: pyridoxamine 5'-phosphate oxidase family protein [Bacteroides sp.]|nr:pyridoxamine 5'-phosphate oxidase family protein [Bacteroides sp.]
MRYHNTTIRRQDRLLEEHEALSLLNQGEFGVLSMVTPEGEPYGIPINYVWDQKDSIYFHRAVEGRKLNSFAQCASASFCVVGKTRVISNHFTTEYESIVLKGEMNMQLSEQEGMEALALLLDKYSPNDKAIGLQYAARSFHRTRILWMDVTEITGKCKRM